MSECPTRQKFPEGSTNRDYDVFEEFRDGSTVWRACVFGTGNAEMKLRELARESNNKFFALYLYERSQPVIHPSKSLARQRLRGQVGGSP
jgi:hypothetical protein